MRRALSELLGTGALVAVVVGSGAMAVNLSSDKGIELLINAASTVLALAILILILAPVSGAHFNPVVTLSQYFQRHISSLDAVAFIVAQLLGGLAGVGIANLMFKNPAYFQSHHVRSGAGTWLSEVVATAGLLFVIQCIGNQKRTQYAPIAVAAWIGSAYLFTSSTSFANPAVTLARGFTNTFSGIALRSIPGFVIAQCIGAALGTVCGHYFSRERLSDE